MGCVVSRKKVVKNEDNNENQSVNLNLENVDVGGVRRSSRATKSFTYRELGIATGSFDEANMIGEGGFGKVFKGRLQSGEIVAVKQLNHEGLQGTPEFIVEVLMLSVLHHPNLMKLRGFCSDGDEKLVVYEYMPKGSLDDHLFDMTPDKTPLDWNTRMKIAVDTARGLGYLHCAVNPPVVFRDLKPANILLDNEFNARLSDFGLAKFGPVGDNTHVSTRVMGTFGYCAPEYAMSGKLTVNSDVYSLGVVLMELITGRKAIDSNRPRAQQSLVDWSRPFFTNRRRYRRLADPALQGQFPSRSFHQVVAISAMCLQEQPEFRPLISDVLAALEFIAAQPYNPQASSSGSQRGYPPSLRDRSRF